MGGRVSGGIRLRGMALLAGTALIMPLSGAVSTAAGASVTWQIQASPDVTLPSGQIQAISCRPAGACVAVGYYLGPAGLYLPLAESWNGTSWRQRAAPAPAGAQAPGLNGVSCLSASFCEAVGVSEETVPSGGTGYAAMWNGSSWSLQSVPSPAGATAVLLKAVSCVSASFCEAVGAYENGSNAILSLAEEWNGTTWTVQPTPNQSGSTVTRLDAVSCVSAQFCQAVDFYAAMVEEWNGTSWAAHSVPVPSGVTGQAVNAVSCTSTAFCEAVGTYANPSRPGTLTMFAERWNGASWRAQSVRDPANWKVFTAVSCVSAISCEAVGYKEVAVSGADTFHAVAVGWNGTSWQAQSAPSAPGTGPTELNGVSCGAADACEAGGGFPARIEAWNGTSWATARAVVPREAVNNALAGVSCVTATFCEAAGSATGAPALPEEWNGSAWMIQPLAAPISSLTAVSCVTVTFCEAVGVSSAGQAAATAAATWNGTSWQPQPTPGSAYSAVSCVSPAFCQAVGVSGAAIWNGTAWSAGSLPVPFPGSYSGVSCASATSCEAVGTGSAPGGRSAFAAGWNGTTWTGQPVPGPSGATYTSLSRVSCPAASACAAVGASSAGAYVAAWDGSAWTVQALVPVPPGSSRDTLTGVSCTSAAACVAVGYSTGSVSPFPQLTLAEGWDGTSWSIQPTPSPAPTRNDLYGVSCVTAGPCVAAGLAPDPGGYTTTLVESTG